jgi:N-acetylglucosamine-1-phosphate uridyltransferase (contains nucleotidyltransferase and I-patch acetyltransferase domains)
MSAFIHDTAEVGPDATVGDGSSIWHLVQVRERAVIGRDCVVGRGAYVGPGVSIGDGTKIQNYALVYDPAVIGRGVFIGPAVVLTNDVYPRSVAPDLSPKRADGWDAAGVTIGDGASVGARSVVLAGVSIGEWALVAAGSVVIRDVPPFALVAGNPARWKGWVGRTGKQLVTDDGRTFRCVDTGDRFELDGERLLPIPE